MAGVVVTAQAFCVRVLACKDDRSWFGCPRQWLTVPSAGRYRSIAVVSAEPFQILFTVSVSANTSNGGAWSLEIWVVGQVSAVCVSLSPQFSGMDFI